jgi:hypothetical protein
MKLRKALQEQEEAIDTELQSLGITEDEEEDGDMAIESSTPMVLPRRAIPAPSFFSSSRNPFQMEKTKSRFQLTGE